MFRQASQSSKPKAKAAIQNTRHPELAAIAAVVADLAHLPTAANEETGSLAELATVAELSTNNQAIAAVPTNQDVSAVPTYQDVAAVPTNQVTPNRNPYIVDPAHNHFELPATDVPPFDYTPVPPPFNFTQLDEDKLCRVTDQAECSYKQTNNTVEANTKQSPLQQSTVQPNASTVQAQAHANRNVPLAGPDSGIPRACNLDEKTFQKFHSTIRYKMKPADRQNIINFRNFCIIKCGLEVNETRSASEDNLHQKMYNKFLTSSFPRKK